MSKGLKVMTGKSSAGKGVGSKEEIHEVQKKAEGISKQLNNIAGKKILGT